MVVMGALYGFGERMGGVGEEISENFFRQLSAGDQVGLGVGETIPHPIPCTTD